MKKSMRVFCFVLVLVLVAPLTVLAQDATPEATPDLMQPMMGLWDQCPTPMNLPDTVNVGAIFGQTGSIAAYGIPQTQGVQLAVQQINDSGYLGEGTTLNVMFEDSGADAEQAINAMTKLVQENQVTAVIGPTLSTQAFSADPVAQENGTVVLGVSNTANGITDMGDYVFRDSLPESSVIPGAVAEAKNYLNLTRVGVLYGNDDDFTVSGYNVFVQALQDNNIEITATETFSKGDVDFSAQLTNLLATNPDALVVSALVAEATEIVLQARDAGFAGPIIGGNGFNSPALANDAGVAANGVIVGAAWQIDNPTDVNQHFVAEYQAAYDSSPDQFVAQAYTGAWLIATAIRCADSVDHAAVRDSLAGIQNFSSPLGDFSFDENRNPVHNPVVQVIRDGKFEILGADTASGS